MITPLSKHTKCHFRLFLSGILILAFLLNLIGPLPIVQAQDFVLPAPGVMVPLSPEFSPPILKGIKVHPDNPFRFDFILDKGDSSLVNQTLKVESFKLIKYFLASLTIPEKDLWVNLSPYEKDRIIPQSFGLTEMGRDLLAEDYMLKQITASLIYPEDEIGKRFWKRVYEESAKRYGTTNIPVNTFNKVWIVPEKAVVYENAKAGSAYVVESKLKVMLEQDYLSLEKHEGTQSNRVQTKDTNQLGSQIVREVVIPELTKEINENRNFAQLRQIYNSLILATWYKKKIKDSILSLVYADKNKVAGVNISDPKEKEKIYQRYLKAFKKGVYNYIKEEQDLVTQETIPRKYFSGGVNYAMIGQEAEKIIKFTNDLPDAAMISDDNAVVVEARLDQTNKTITQKGAGDSVENHGGSNSIQVNDVERSFYTGDLDSEKKVEILIKRLLSSPSYEEIRKIIFLFSFHKEETRRQFIGLVDDWLKVLGKNAQDLNALEQSNQQLYKRKNEIEQQVGLDGSLNKDIYEVQRQLSTLKEQNALLRMLNSQKISGLEARLTLLKNQQQKLYDELKDFKTSQEDNYKKRNDIQASTSGIYESFYHILDLGEDVPEAILASYGMEIFPILDRLFSRYHQHENRDLDQQREARAADVIRTIGPAAVRTLQEEWLQETLEYHKRTYGYASVDRMHYLGRALARVGEDALPGLLGILKDHPELTSDVINIFVWMGPKAANAVDDLITHIQGLEGRGYYNHEQILSIITASNPTDLRALPEMMERIRNAPYDSWTVSFELAVIERIKNLSNENADILIERIRKAPSNYNISRELQSLPKTDYARRQVLPLLVQRISNIDDRNYDARDRKELDYILQFGLGYPSLCVEFFLRFVNSHKGGWGHNTLEKIVPKVEELLNTIAQKWNEDGLPEEGIAILLKYFQGNSSSQFMRANEDYMHLFFKSLLKSSAGKTIILLIFEKHDYLRNFVTDISEEHSPALIEAIKILCDETKSLLALDEQSLYKKEWSFDVLRGILSSNPQLARTVKPVIPILMDLIVESATTHRDRYIQIFLNTIRQIGTEEVPAIFLALTLSRFYGYGEDEKQNAIKVLGTITKEQAVAVLTDRAKNDADSRIRRAAISALEEIAPQESKDLFIERSKNDSDTRVRGYAAYALKYINTPEVVEALMDRARNDEDAYVRRMGIVALGYQKNQQAIAFFIARLKNDADPWVRKEIVELLGKIDDPQSVDAISYNVEHEQSPAVWIEAVKVLRSKGRISGRISLDVFVKKLSDEDHKVRTLAVEVLATFNSPEAVSALVDKVVNDTNVNVRVTAINSLVNHKESQAAVDAIIDRAKNDIEETVRQAGVSALGQINTPSSFEALNDRLENDSESRVRQYAVWSLQHIGTNEAVEAIAKRVKVDSDGSVRKFGVDALERTGTTQAVILLANLTRDGFDVETRQSCIKSLGVIGNKEAVQSLERLARDSNEEKALRIEAISSLGKASSTLSTNALIGLVRTDSDPEFRKECLLALSQKSIDSFTNNADLGTGYSSIVELFNTLVAASPNVARAFQHSLLMNVIADNQLTEDLTKDLVAWQKHENNLSALLSFISLSGGSWTSLGISSEKIAFLVQEIIKSGVTNYVNMIESWLESNINNEAYQPFRDFMVNNDVDLNLRMKVADDFLELMAVDTLLAKQKEESTFSQDLVKTLTATRDGLNQMIEKINAGTTSSARRKAQEKSATLLESMRNGFLRYVLGRELSSKETALLKNPEASRQVLVILSVLSKLSFNENILMRQVAKDFFNVLFLEYDEADKEGFAKAKAKLNAFIMEFDQNNLTKSNANRQQFEKSNKETLEELVAAGYSRDLWEKGVEFTTNVSAGITEEKKRESIRQASFEMVEIALALGVKTINGQEVTIEMASEINNYEKAKTFLGGLRSSVSNISQEREDRLEDILHFIERKESEVVIKVQDESKFRVVVKKDFLREATAGLGVPGCFNPNGLHKEMPLMHAMEINAGFIQIYNDSGRQVANAVIVYGKEGAYVYTGYNSSSYDMNYVFGRALAELSRYVPRLVLQPGSSGYEYLNSFGEKINEQVKVTKTSTIFKDQYFDSGNVDENGNLTITIDNPLIVTSDSIKAKGGFPELEFKQKEEAVQETKQEVKKPDIDFQKLATMFIERGSKKYLFIVNLLKKKVSEEGRLAIDDGFYMWVNTKVKEKFKSEVNIIETDEITDLMVDFLEQQNWPMEIMTARGDAAMVGQNHRRVQSSFLTNGVGVKNPGGIDLTPANMNFQTRNVGGEIKFHLDPAIIQQLQNALGFVPVIINIQPMTDLRQFLGLNVQEGSPVAS